MITPQPVLACEGLFKRFGDLEAVKGVSLIITPGETYGLLGPNGAGKTTVISMTCGLLGADAGTISVMGQEMTPSSVGAKAAIGLVPQDLAVYPDLTARENLAFFARLYGMRRADARPRIDEVLEIIGLADRAGDLVKTYSGGMKRRLNIGVGLLHQPQLLVLDEPTVGVDPQSRSAILDAVASLSDAGMAVLYTTHYMEEAERLCDRVGIIDRGELRAEGTRRELVALVGEHDRIHLAVGGDAAAGAEAARGLEGVHGATSDSGFIDLIVEEASSLLPELLSRVGAAGVSINAVEIKEPDLEAVFLHLTGRALRD